MAEIVTITIDFEESLHQEIEQTAKDLNLSIDQLLAELIQGYLERYKFRKMIDPQEMIDKINEVYSDERVRNETIELARQMQPFVRNLVQDTW